MSVHQTPRPKELPFQISLHLRHPSIDPAEVSGVLQLPALESFKAGAQRTSRSGIAATAVHVETYWAAIIDPLTWSLPASILEPTRRTEGRGQPEDAAHEARILRVRFGVDAASEGRFSLGWALWLVCAGLHSRHGEFLRRLAGQGGSLTLLVAHSPEALSGFRLLPDTARQVSDLGLTLKFELTDSESWL